MFPFPCHKIFDTVSYMRGIPKIINFKYVKMESFWTYYVIAVNLLLVHVVKLGLTLIELIQISLFESYTCMSFIDLYKKYIMTGDWVYIWALTLTANGFWILWTVRSWRIDRNYSSIYEYSAYLCFHLPLINFRVFFKICSGRTFAGSGIEVSLK